MELVGPRLDLDVDRCTTGHSLLRVEAVGNDVDHLNRILRWNVGDNVRQPRIADSRTIEPRVVVRV